MTAEMGHTRPGGRTARTREAVLEAVADLLADEGPAAVTIEAVARTAGVHPSTLYRRWGSVPGLVADLAERFDAAAPELVGASLEDDLEAIAQQLAGRLTARNARLLQALVGWREPSVRGVLDRFFEQRRTGVASALARHQSAADPRLVLRLLAGPLHYCALVEGRTPDGATVRAAIAAARDAAALRPSSTS